MLHSKLHLERVSARPFEDIAHLRAEALNICLCLVVVALAARWQKIVERIILHDVGIIHKMVVDAVPIQALHMVHLHLSVFNIATAVGAMSVILRIDQFADTLRNGFVFHLFFLFFSLSEERTFHYSLFTFHFARATYSIDIGGISPPPCSEPGFSLSFSSSSDAFAHDRLAPWIAALMSSLAS